jgi:hypothetical protein
MISDIRKYNKYQQNERRVEKCKIKLKKNCGLKQFGAELQGLRGTIKVSELLL